MIHFACDGCDAVSVAQRGTATEARIANRRTLGWSTGRGKHNRVLDFCPTCTGERRAKLAAEGPTYV